MLCDRVFGPWSEHSSARAAEAHRLDWLDLNWEQCHRRAIAATTRRGLPVRLLLRLGIVLRHLDIVADTPDRLIVVSVKPVETVVVRPRTLEEAALVALEWGNLHLPVEIGQAEIVTIADGPAEGVLQQHGFEWSTQIRRFQPMRISGMSWNVSVGGQAGNAGSELGAKRV